MGFEEPAIVSEAVAARRANKQALAAMLVEARARSLRLLAAYEAALGPDMRMPCHPELNLPLWELGHVAWFADWWIARNPHRTRGVQADPHVPRMEFAHPARGTQADSIYNSSTVAHGHRWQIALPPAATTRAHLEASLADTLALLRSADDSDTGLYFHRLVLFHEDMHAEAAVYMAQALGFDPGESTAPTSPAPQVAERAKPMTLPAGHAALGWSGPGFAFDNELGAHRAASEACEIDTRAITWARYLPFVEQGGYRERRFWSDAGWQWREQTGATAPRYLRDGVSAAAPDGTSRWEQQRWGQWQAVDLNHAACHLTAFEAQAWCAWAGRRLPTEAQWQLAAQHNPQFVWGEVWEWTASPFAPFPGFAAHPYVDYSQPWFDGRPVLKGASPATVPRMRHPSYRNYFTPERCDILAGFRSVLC